jgi:signal transduction histidine kinase
MKGLLGAEILLCDGQMRPLLDDKGKPITTLEMLPDHLPEPAEASSDELGPRVQVGDQVFFCRRVPLGQETQPGLYLYIFYPEILWKEALDQAVRPALVVGSIGGLTAFLLAASLAGRVTRRIQDMGRRTRQIAGGDFSPMPLPRRNDELRDLAGFINDMAQRLAQLQEAVLRTERLRLLGQVSGGLAHQLRNAVTGANLAVQMHAQECPIGAKDEVLAVARRQLTLVEMHLKRFLNLGKDLELRFQPCSLPPLLDEAIALLGPQCRHAGIDLRWHKVDDGPAWLLRGDPGQLSYLFVNVLTNAIEAAGPGGWVAVRLTEKGDRTDSRRAVIEVLDSGPGVSPDIAPRLFEPFVTGKPEGVGLGLAVARQVVEAHGGSICWSRESEGTCFRIELRLEG